jgi:hypothetical protein
MGAFELQPLPAAFFGDYNQDGVADAADYVVWRKTLGGSVANYSGADGNGDGQVTSADLAVWKSHFGDVVMLGAGSASQQFATAEDVFAPAWVAKVVPVLLQTASSSGEPIDREVTVLAPAALTGEAVDAAIADFGPLPQRTALAVKHSKAGSTISGILAKDPRINRNMLLLARPRDAFFGSGAENSQDILLQESERNDSGFDDLDSQLIRAPFELSPGRFLDV